MAVRKKRELADVTPTAKDLSKEEPVQDSDLAADVVDDENLRLMARDFGFLNRALRFLMGVQTPAFLKRARREGYTEQEHRTGLALWQAAAGMGRPLDHFFARDASTAADRVEELRLLQEIDSFENTWFPRTRAIIRRVVAKDRRGAFEKAFFADLAQQPLGPSVVGSVTGLLSRIEGLEESTQPDAKSVRQVLQARGVTAAKVKAVRTLIEELGKLKSVEIAPDRMAVQAADRAQLEALEQLRDWYVDWATTLRSVFAVPDQVRLGLTVLRRAKPAPGNGDSDESPAEPTPAEPTPAEPTPAADGADVD